MKIRSDSFEHGKPIPAEFALGARDGNGGFGGNRNPQLAWTDVPAGVRSFALVCIDTDAPTDGALVANADVDIPVEHPRGDFVHWVVANIPADVREIAAGSCSDGVTKGGKGVGELASIPATPAIHGAYYHLDGVFRTSLPLKNTFYKI